MPGYVEQAVSFGPFTLHRSDKLLLEAGREVRLGERTLDLLIALVERPGEVVSKQTLISCVWGESAVEETTLRAHIAMLRTVLGEGQDGQRYIVNVAGRGYCFVATPQLHRVAAAPPPEAARVAASQHNLPDPLTRVIGRDDLIAAIAEQLPRRRFVCIAGPAGMGKTTVALAVAERLLTHYRDGIRFVDLSLILQTALVPAALAGALETVIATDQPVESLVKFLTNKSMLVVLDNCEHVAESVAEVAVAILKSGPNIDVLATSREPLRAEGEWVQRLPPLEAPPAKSEFTATQALAYPAVRLFVERSIASVDSFALADKDAALACEICRRLDGMPLAIELAAARMAAFGIRGLMRALDDRLNALTSRQKTGLARHRTLAALLDWSHEMLPPAERATFRRLSVFRGGFSLESAQAVAAVDGISARQVVEAVASLAAKSLISVEIRQKDVHYRLLETTRAYAFMQLADRDEVAVATLLHARRICELLESASDSQTSLSRAEWIDLYSWLIGDVRAAIDWALRDDGDAAIGVRLAAATIQLSSHLSLQEEFYERLRIALKRARTLQPAAPLIEMRLNAYFAAVNYHTRGPSAEMARATERALELSNLPELVSQRSEGVHGAWIWAFANGAYERSSEFADALANTARDSPRQNVLLTVDRIRAQTQHFSGKHDLSRELAQRVIAHPNSVNRLSVAQAFALDRNVSMRILLARIHWIQGRPEQAADVAQECVAIASTDVTYALCQALAFAACPIALWMGDRAAALSIAERLIEHSTEKKFSYWTRWANNFLRVLSVSDGAYATKREPDRIILDIDDSDNKQRDLFATFGAFGGHAQVVDRASRGGGAWCRAEVLRQHGEWLICGGRDDAVAAESFFRQALTISREQGAVSWELRASMSLARLMKVSGKPSDASQLLATAFGRFAEGFDSADLIEARRMLEALDAGS